MVFCIKNVKKRRFKIIHVHLGILVFIKIAKILEGRNVFENVASWVKCGRHRGSTRVIVLCSP